MTLHFPNHHILEISQVQFVNAHIGEVEQSAQLIGLFHQGNFVAPLGCGNGCLRALQRHRLPRTGGTAHRNQCAHTVTGLDGADFGQECGLIRQISVHEFQIKDSHDNLDLTIAWEREVTNPAVPLFVELFRTYMQEHLERF